VQPRVINVDGHPAYARAIRELKRSGELGPRCRCRPAPYLNNVIEQEHRFIKKRIAASLWFRSAEGALRTIDGYEAMHLIRKGQIRWLHKGDVVGQRRSFTNLRHRRMRFSITRAEQASRGPRAVCNRSRESFIIASSHGNSSEDRAMGALLTLARDLLEDAAARVSSNVRGECRFEYENSAYNGGEKMVRVRPLVYGARQI